MVKRFALLEADENNSKFYLALASNLLRIS